MIQSCKFFLLLVVLATNVCGVVVVPPYYNFSSLYKTPTVPGDAGIEYLSRHEFIQQHYNSCLSETKLPKHAVNKARHIANTTEAVELSNFLPGTTYWLNEYMHVGHLLYDIVLMQLLKTTKIDRIVMQRAACNAKLCVGVGTFRSFFGAYFAGIQDAFQPDIPLYIRYTWHEKSVQPYFVSTTTPTYEVSDAQRTARHKSFKEIHLHHEMCFENVIRRGAYYNGNYYGSVSPEAVQAFRAKALASPNLPVRASPHFSAQPPYRILVSLRDSGGTRRIDNQDLLMSTLQAAFAPPTYAVVHFDNGNASTTSEEQIAAVAASNVVVTNHGAFEGNIIYMRNGTLLVELSGSYYNPEFNLFQRFAHMFGVYFARISNEGLQDHQQGNYNITAGECSEVAKTIEQYFDVKPFLFNAK